MSNLRKNLGALALSGTMVIGGMAATAAPAHAQGGWEQPPCGSMGCPQPVWTGGGEDRLGENVANGYRSANRWCDENALTCALATGFGFMLIAPFVAPARG